MLSMTSSLKISQWLRKFKWPTYLRCLIDYFNTTILHVSMYKGQNFIRCLLMTSCQDQFENMVINLNDPPNP